MRRAAAGLPWGACMLGTLLLVQLAVVANGFLAPLPAQGARMRIAAVRRPLVCMSQGEPEEPKRWRWEEWGLRLPEGSKRRKVLDAISQAGIFSAAILRNAPPWDKGLGVNPTPPTFLQIYGSYIFTILFLTFGLRGADSIKKIIFQLRKNFKDARKASRPKKKPKYYRATSKLYEMAKSKMQAGQGDAKGDVKPQDGSEEQAEGDEEGTEEEQKEEAPLSAYRCEVCSYTIYPAPGREFKFFPDTFKCPSCGATKDKFYDLTDEDDPRNKEPEGLVEGDVDDDFGDADSLRLDDEEVPPEEGAAEEEEAPVVEGEQPVAPADSTGLDAAPEVPPEPASKDDSA